MQVRKANRVVLAAAAAVVVSGLVSTAQAQTWQTNYRQNIVSNGDDTLRVYTGGWSDPTFTYAIPLTTSATQYGVTWNWTNSAYYVLEDNFIQVLWDGGTATTAIKGPRWDISSQGFDIAYSTTGGGELYVTKRDSNIYVYNAQTGAAKRTMAISGASSLHGIGIDWNRGDTTMLTVGDWGKGVGGYRISQTNGSFGTSWFAGGHGGLNYLYNGFGYMTAPSVDNGGTCLYWFYDSGSGIWTTGTISSRPSGEAWDWEQTESVNGFMMSFQDSNTVGWWASSQTSPSRWTTMSVNNPRGVFFKRLGNPTAPTANSLISQGFSAGGFLDNNTPAMAATVYNSMSGANQTIALNTATPQGVANLIGGVAFTQGLTMFNALAASSQTSVFNLFAATSQASFFPALDVGTRTTLFPAINTTSKIVALPTVAVTEQVSLFTPLTLTTQTTVFNGLAASSQVTLFGAVSAATRGSLYPTLAVTSQTTLLSTVSVADQVLLFTPLALTTQTTVFNGQAASVQTTLFNALGGTTQNSLFPTLAETTQLALFPTLTDNTQVSLWPAIAATTQGSLFSGTATITALNNVTITASTTSGAGSAPTFTSIINGASLGVNAILSGLGSGAVAVRGGQGDGNSGEGTLTMGAPIDYDSLTTNQTLSLRASGALLMNEDVFDSNTGTARNLSLNLVARNALTIGTLPATGDMELNADILLTGGALNTKSFAGNTLIDMDSVIIANGGITMTGASFTQDAGAGSITSTANATGNISIIASAGDVTLMNPITASGTGAGNVTIGAPATATITLGAVSASGTLTLNADAADVSLTDSVDAGNFTVNGATGARVFGDDVAIAATGAVTMEGDSFTQGPGTGSISTTANNTGNISITAGAGDISLLNPISAAGTAAGNIDITGAAGSAIELADVTASGMFTVNGDGTTSIDLLGAVDSGGAEVYADGSTVTLAADVTGGSFSVIGSTGDRAIGGDVVIATTGNVGFDGATVDQPAGTGSITSDSGDISISASSGDVSMLNAMTATAGSVTVGASSGTSITLADVVAGSSFVVNGDDTAAISLAGVTAASSEVYSSGAGTLAFDGVVSGGDLLVAKSGGTADYSTTVSLTGTFTMDGGDHAFAATSDVSAGSVVMTNGATVSTEAPFAVTSMDLGGGTFTTTSDLSATTLALSGGTLNIESGAGTISVGTLDGAGGTAQVRSDATFDTLDLGSGGTFNVHNGVSATVSSSLGSDGTVNVLSGSTLTVDSAVPGSSAAISVTGGTLVLNAEPSSGGSGVTFSNGTIQIASDATYATGNGTARFMGSSLGTGRTFIVDGTLTLNSAYTLAGGRLSAGDIANSYFLTQTSGTFELTASTFQVDAAGQFGETLTMNTGRVIELSGTSTGEITDGSTLVMSGGRFVVGAGVTLANDGDVQFTNSNSRLHGDGTFENTGLVTGTGRLDVSETNNLAGGIIRASSGNYLRLGTTLNNADGGRVEIQSAAVDINLLVNDGLITMSTSSTLTGKPTLRLGTDIASLNSGNVFISGEADFFGDMNNSNSGAGGVVRIGGGGVVNFFDDFDNTDADEFQIAGGSAAVFFSSLTLGGTSVTGDGTLVVMGTLNLRSNQGGSSLGGDLTLGETSTAVFGVGEHADFGSMIVTGDALLGGNLVLEESGYRHLGDTYELFSASNISGQFENITLPEPGWGMNYELRFTGNSISAVVVPEPATLSALAGLVALGLRRRRH